MSTDSAPTSWIIVGSVLVLVLGGIISNRNSPKTIRPLSEDVSTKLEISPSRVPARLWQDPIEVGWERIRSIRSSQSKEKSAATLFDQWKNANRIVGNRTGRSTTDLIRSRSWNVAPRSTPLPRERESEQPIPDEVTRLIDQLAEETISIAVQNWLLATLTEGGQSSVKLFLSKFSDDSEVRNLAKIRLISAILPPSAPSLKNVASPSLAGEIRTTNHVSESERLTRELALFLLAQKLEPVRVEQAGEFASLPNPETAQTNSAATPETGSASALEIFQKLKSESQGIEPPAFPENSQSDFSVEGSAMLPAGFRMRQSDSGTTEKITWSGLVRRAKALAVDAAIAKHPKAQEPAVADGDDREWLRRILKSRTTTILPIVVSGEAYRDARELRLRNRYALQEAMEASGFQPRNYDELGYFPVPIDIRVGIDLALLGKPVIEPDPEDKEASGVMFVPITFEVFEKFDFSPDEINQAVRTEQVVVLWIDDRIVNLGAKPLYENLLMVSDRMTGTASGHLDIVTMRGSEDLRKIFFMNTFPEKLHLHYPKSTAPLSKLIPAKKGAVIRVNEEQIVRVEGDLIIQPEGDEAEPDAGAIPFNISRTLPNDDYAIYALLDELKLRIPGLVKSETEDGDDDDDNPEKEIWIFAEQDTLYSDSMVDSVRKGAERLNANVRDFRYLRGIDGNLPGPTKSEFETAPITKGVGTLTGIAQLLSSTSDANERPFDRTQTDYLQRLADQLQQEQRSHGLERRVKAIGILGSDVYDKLLILQILRSRFPAVVFFTTELDAAYLHPDAAGSSRNLVIATAMDSETGDKKNYFRDCFQTSLYEAVKAIITEDHGKDLEPSPKEIKLFEVGRTQFIPLTVPKPVEWHPGIEWSQADQDRFGARTDQPTRSGEKAPEPDSRPVENGGIVDRLKINQTSFWLIAGVILVALLVGPRLRLRSLSLCLLELTRISGKSVWDRLPPSVKNFRLPFPFRKPQSAGEPEKEPSLLDRTLSKITRWFTEVCRPFFRNTFGNVGLVWFSLTFIFLIAFWFSRETLFDLIEKQFEETIEPTFVFEGVSIWPAVVIRIFAFGFAICFFRRNLRQVKEAISQLPDRFSKSAVGRGLTVVSAAAVAVFVLVLVGLSVELSSRFTDSFFVPARGNAAFFMHYIALILCISVLYFGTGLAFVLHQECRRFIKRNNGTELFDDDEIKRLNHYGDAASRSLFAPFAITVLLIASRHSLFDNWNLPFAFALAMGIVLAFLLSSAFRLMRTAERMKRNQLFLADEESLPTEEEKSAARIGERWKHATGPFGSFRQQPIVQAVLFVFAGVGLNFLDPILKFVGL